MSRRAEIEKAAKEYSAGCSRDPLELAGFIAGADWADSNPKYHECSVSVMTCEKCEASKEREAKLVEALEWISDFNMGESNLRDDIIDIKSRARKVLSEIRGQKA